MSRSLSRRFALAAFLAPAFALLIYACSPDHSQPVEPQILGARSAAPEVPLTVITDSSKAGGTVMSTRGEINCTVAVSKGHASHRGNCERQFKTGIVTTVTAIPAVKGGSATLSGCTGVTEDPLACEVSLNEPRTLTVAFTTAATSYPLTVTAGAGGSGKVTSSPSGISCTITNGSTGTVKCSANFPVDSSISLFAAAVVGSHLKAWAGGGCDKVGTGVGTQLGKCVVKMTQAQNVVVSYESNSLNASVGKWDAPISWPAIAIHANLLPDGRVLTWGRSDRVPVLWTPPATSGTAGTFSSVTKPADTFCGGQAFLPDGRLLTTGGHSGTNSIGIRNSTIFNFATNTWTSGPLMRNGRWYPTATALADGEVLTLSGGDTAGQRNLIPEVFQTSGTWRVLSTASLYLEYYPMMFVTPTGTVFAAGPSKGTYYLDASGTGRWTVGPSSNFGLRDYGSALMYDAGKILLVGGGAPTATAEVIDLNAGSAAAWRSVAPMSVARRQMNATILADGKVLVTGGSNASGFNSPPSSDAVLASELWDPATEKWTTLSRMTHYRLYHSTALLLPDGRVLSVGSGQPAATGFTDDYTAEIFSPPYLFNSNGSAATRPTISGVPARVAYGQSFAVQTPSPSTVSKVTLISLAAVTHSFNENQRAMKLTFAASGTTAINVTAPARAALAPPGYYLLFVIDSHGVPSVGKIVRVG